MATAHEDIQDNYVNVVVPTASVPSMKLDNVPVDGSLFLSVPGSSFSAAQLAVGVGHHSLTADSPFGVTVYGLDNFDTYAYPGGLSLDKPNAAASILLTANHSSLEVGSEMCVVAQLLDSASSPIARGPVSIDVSGINTKKDFSITDDLGQAQFCYVGGLSGIDTISASSALASESVSINWQQYSGTDNLPPVVVSSPPDSRLASGEYLYSVFAVDPNGDSLTYSLTGAPSGMTISSTGDISWNAPSLFEQTRVVITVDDGNGGVANQALYFTSFYFNTPPTFVAEPGLQTVAAQHRWLYQFSAVDEDALRSALQFELVEAPDFVSGANESGFLFGDSAVFSDRFQTVEGTYPITIAASDLSGGVAYQSFDLVVTPNQPPVVVNEPPLVASVGSLYQFQLEGFDPEDDSIRFSRPPGFSARMSVSSSGVLTLFPNIFDVGDIEVGVRLDDFLGAQSIFTYTLSVFDNASPVISSQPDNAVFAGSTYSYQITAADPESDPLSYTLTSAPAAMSIDVNGLISWSTTEADVGDYGISLRVQDDKGGFEDQTFTLTVSPDNAAPTIAAIADQTITDAASITIQVDASDSDNDPLSYNLSDAPAGASIDTDGVITWTPTDTQLGDFTFTVDASDVYATACTSFTVTVTENTDLTAPLITLTQPLTDTTITDITSLMGSISDENLQSWQVLMHYEGSDDQQVLASGNVEVADATIIDIDPTLLMNGLYKITVEASDEAGNTASEILDLKVDADLKVGNFSISFNDLSIPMVGIPIEITRTYDTRQKHEALDFGYGWSIDYQNVDLQESRIPGSRWALNSYPGQFGIPTYCVEADGKPLVTVTLPDGQVESFVVKASPRCNQAIPLLDVALAFTPEAGTTSTLDALDDNAGRLNQGIGALTDITDSAPINPSRYALTTKAGYVYTLNQTFGIEQVVDPNGHTLTYSDAGIVHSAGKSISFNRDTEGRITGITDPAGNTISYSHDAAGDLIAVTDRESATTEFTYNSEHALVDIIDPLGRRIVRNIYDDDGRLTAQEDSDGNRTEFDHNLEGKESIITDRLGRITIFYYDERGNVTSKVDALGHTYTYTYDTLDNQLTETNPLGHTTTATFDERYNQLSQSDALGNTFTYSYNDLGQEIFITDARGNSFDNVYDAVGNLLSVTDPLGRLAGQNINAQGLVSLRRDADGFETTIDYDDEGNITQETDAEGGVTTYTYDENNNTLSESRTRTVNGVTVIDTTTYEYNDRDQMTKTIDALGNVRETEYDALGREIAQIDAKGRRTTMDYDDYGRLTSTTYPDGSSSSSIYDVEGNKLSDTDRLGRTTGYTYDALNRMVSTTYADNTSMSKNYDAAGRMVSETDARGNTMSYDYDAANRRTSGTDAIGNTRVYGYDADSNMTSETDARGNITGYTYNALDQRITTTFADNTTMETGFDKRGFEIKKTDQLGRTTDYAYDGLGRLTSVTDALNQVTSYGYDEVGNKLTQTDALGRVTTWAYDAINRPLSRTLPLGQVETYAYDEVGNRTSYTDFNGATHSFTYDANNDWLTIENWADGNTTSYTYNTNGTRATATDANGTFSYSYDNRDRLTREIKYDGSELVYDYDANGNRTTLTTLVNGNTSTATYSFDALNRLESVTDDNNNVTVYAYDANSNQTRIDQANGTATEMVFDELNRVTEITHLGNDNSVLSQLNYTLDDTGRRTAINEANGRSSSYGYDALYRLTSESIIDPDVGNHNATFNYDAVSNRTQVTENGIITGYSYDDNDRLQSAGSDTYSYDDNGNTISESVDGIASTYTYNSKNRLTAANRGGVVQLMSYDPDDARIQKTIGGETTDYLVDTNRDYGQVLVETTPTTELNYTFGNDLVGLSTGTADLTYHSDAIGSTRLLTDGSGNTADDVRYDAWGEQLAGGDVAENQYLYTGEQYDDGLGKVYLRARYMSTGVGRFSQMDQWEGTKENPITQNKYLYGSANPVLYNDPSGFTSSLHDIQAATTTNLALQSGATRTIAIGTVAANDAVIATNGANALVRGLYAIAALGGSYAIFEVLGNKNQQEEDENGPQTILYHGTSANRAYKIKEFGFRPPERGFVFLTDNLPTAEYFARQSLNQQGY